ncbi:MAG: ankyrin repeat domain-containing protein [Deltaproteobacteria bacterium]|nr:ankyrin repeat domain-containing protein [Deltaproteobacteria bacterium]
MKPATTLVGKLEAYAGNRWKWLSKPLPPKTRARLEISLGVVVSAAAMVMLSTVVPPDPAKVAAKIVVPPLPSEAELRGDSRLRTESTVDQTVPPEIARAVADGDVAALDRLHRPGMPLAGMLSVAADAGHDHVIGWLLDHGADVHEDESGVDSPLLAGDAHPKVIALLLERGAAEATLTTAARAAAPNAIDRLLAKKADVNPPDGSPVAEVIATRRSTPEVRRAILEKLLDAKPDLNRDVFDSPLAAAVRTCDALHELDEQDPKRADHCVATMKLLIARGAHVKAEALEAANGLDAPLHGRLLDILLAAKIERGATARALSSYVMWTPEETKRLVGKGIDWAWHDGEDDAALPLLSAISRGDRDLAKTLLDAGAPVNFRYKDGKCALGEAIDGAQTNAPEAARLVELLIARGADVNRRLPDGRTPLFAAAETGDIRIINALLERGARVNEVVLEDSPLDAAEQNAHVAAARVLHAHGGRRATKRTFP